MTTSPLSIRLFLNSLLASNYVSIDDTSAEKVQYEKVLESEKPLASQSGPVGVVVVTAYNELGIPWSNRSEN